MLSKFMYKILSIATTTHVLRLWPLYLRHVTTTTTTVGCVTTLPGSLLCSIDHVVVPTLQFIPQLLAHV